nr:probable serine/threonine-protein kinase PBL5 isoform X2 [Cicer arietinum]
MESRVNAENDEVAVELMNLTLNDGVSGEPSVQKFSFDELIAATDNFRSSSVLGQGGFGTVYKGYLPKQKSVAIKRLDPKGGQGTEEFIAEVKTLCKAKHENLVKLIGYCAEGEHKLLVYEYMQWGSVESHLFGRPLGKQLGVLDWNTRIKIALDVAKALKYLHVTMNPPYVYRDLKCSNILLEAGYKAKLSDFGFARIGPIGDKRLVTTRILGTYGYCAPDYINTGHLTFKSDIFSFGVVLLELISGRRAVDDSKPDDEKDLVSLARPIIRDRSRIKEIVDPLLEDKYPWRGLYQMIGIASFCLDVRPNMRPEIADIVNALQYVYSKGCKDQPESYSRFTRVRKRSTSAEKGKAKVTN